VATDAAFTLDAARISVYSSCLVDAEKTDEGFLQKGAPAPRSGPPQINLRIQNYSEEILC
jgi:hypothetical protein